MNYLDFGWRNGRHPARLDSGPNSHFWQYVASSGTERRLSIVARYEGMPLAEETIKDLLGPKWAWKLAKLFKATRFEVGEWQAEAVQLAILQHNLEVQQNWLKAGGDPARSCWWHVTEITLDHLRPSPAWKKQMADLQLAKECEAEIRKRLKALDEKNRDKAEQRRILAEVADSFQASGGQL